MLKRKGCSVHSCRQQGWTLDSWGSLGRRLLDCRHHRAANDSISVWLLPRRPNRHSGGGEKLDNKMGRVAGNFGRILVLEGGSRQLFGNVSGNVDDPLDLFRSQHFRLFQKLCACCLLLWLRHGLLFRVAANQSNSVLMPYPIPVRIREGALAGPAPASRDIAEHVGPELRSADMGCPVLTD